MKRASGILNNNRICTAISKLLFDKNVERLQMTLKSNASMIQKRKKKNRRHPCTIKFDETHLQLMTSIA